VVVLAAGVMLNVSGAELLALKLGSPLYCATTEMRAAPNKTGPVNAALSVTHSHFGGEPSSWRYPRNLRSCRYPLPQIPTVGNVSPQKSSFCG